MANIIIEIGHPLPESVVRAIRGITPAVRGIKPRVTIYDDRIKCGRLTYLQVLGILNNAGINPTGAVVEGRFGFQHISRGLAGGVVYRGQAERMLIPDLSVVSSITPDDASLFEAFGISDETNRVKDPREEAYFDNLQCLGNRGIALHAALARITDVVHELVDADRDNELQPWHLVDIVESHEPEVPCEVSLARIDRVYSPLSAGVWGIVHAFERKGQVTEECWNNLDDAILNVATSPIALTNLQALAI